MDPITGDTILGEQTAAFGYPARFIKIADDVSGSTSNELPGKNGRAIVAGNASLSEIAFDGYFTGAAAAADSLGLLIWYESAGNNVNQIRKLTSVVSDSTSKIFGVNRDWVTSAPSAGDTYRPLIDCFRFNAALIKVEFSTSSTSDTCTIVPHFFSVPQDGAYPTPGVAKPHRYPTRAYTISNTGISTDASDTSATHYHGEILSIGVHGAVGMCLRVTNIVGGGTVSVWVALV